MPQPSAINRSQLIRFVRFEYEMALETARLVADSGEEDFVRKVAFIESFLVHARNLDAFLDSRGFKTDVKAKHYVPNFSMQVIDRQVLSSVNRRLQHITVYRETDQTPWLPMELLPPIVVGMGEFIGELEKIDAQLALRLGDIQTEAEAFVAEMSP